ncbi:MAG: hypothetical protein HYS22_02795 [Deltaproteobacteria bacterium]|nr:hypothetical protein [Deltaproteobacteria bacterium]
MAHDTIPPPAGEAPLGEAPFPYIVVEPDAADGLEDQLDGSDIPISEAIEGDNYKMDRKTTRAFQDDEEASAYESDLFPNDRAITLTELRRAFYATYGTQESRAVAERVFAQMKQELGDTVSKDEIGRFQQILTDQSAHLDAGGIIIDNDLDKGGRLAISVKRQGLTKEDIQRRIIPYDTWKYMKDLELTFDVPVPEEPNAYYEFTITHPGGVAGKVFGIFPAVTKITLAGGNGPLVAKWEMVPHDTARGLVDQYKGRLTEVMREARLKDNPDEYANQFKEELESVRSVQGSVRYDPQTGVLTYEQNVKVSWSPPSDSFVIEPLLTVALHYAGDPRAKKRTKIPCWMSEDDGPMKKKYRYEPALK